MSKTRKKYTPEFKQEAVKLAKEVGFSQAGSELGVHHDNIRKWSKKLESSKQEDSSSSPNSRASLEAENRRLRKENGYLKKINEVLKKSTAIFSKDHIGGLK